MNEINTLIREVCHEFGILKLPKDLKRESVEIRAMFAYIAFNNLFVPVKIIACILNCGLVNAYNLLKMAKNLIDTDKKYKLKQLAIMANLIP